MRVLLIALGVIVSVAAQGPVPGIRVSGLGIKEITLTAAELTELSQQSVRVEDGGRTVLFTGPRLSDVLQRAGIAFGQNHRGPRMAEYLVVGSADGYEVVYALAEIDAQFSSSVPIVAVQQEG